MLLHLVRRDFGSRTANQVAQRLVIAPHREGDQAQFIPRPLSAQGRGRLARLMDFLRAHPDAPHTLRSLARRVHLSARTLQREFRTATGASPRQWLLGERIARARELLETHASAGADRRDPRGPRQCRVVVPSLPVRRHHAERLPPPFRGYRGSMER